jgi:hypothetical protein
MKFFNLFFSDLVMQINDARKLKQIRGLKDGRIAAESPQHTFARRWG